MNKEEREDMQLNLVEMCDGINAKEEACLYLYGKEDFDMVWSGNMDILTDTILEAMRVDKELKGIIREAVRVIDLEEGINFRVN